MLVRSSYTSGVSLILYGQYWQRNFWCALPSDLPDPNALASTNACMSVHENALILPKRLCAHVCMSLCALTCVIPLSRRHNRVCSLEHTHNTQTNPQKFLWRFTHPTALKPAHAWSETVLVSRAQQMCHTLVTACAFLVTFPPTDERTCNVQGCHFMDTMADYLTKATELLQQIEPDLIA